MKATRSNGDVERYKLLAVKKYVMSRHGESVEKWMTDEMSKIWTRLAFDEQSKLLTWLGDAQP